MLYLELLIQGLIYGSMYAIIAVGLTLVYGLLRILHVAHAGLFALGGYMGLLITNSTGSLILGMPLAAALVGVVGMAIYRICYQPILDQPPYVALIASIGLFIAMEEMFRLIFGPFGLTYTDAPLQSVVQFAGIYLRTVDLAIVAGSVSLLGALSWLSQKTRIGLAWRATVDDPQIAESFGISVLNVRYLNFFIGSALAAVAGVFISLLSNLVEPTMGGVPSYKALAIIVLGGLGNVAGTLIASLVLGVVEAFGTIYIGDILDRDAIAFAFLIIVLMIRPEGLFARR
ncbi:branched-chain amino acid ABC transporter permease [Desulfosarcina widdelii]|uniref:Branched-chain amino acid ABC transporter permease n=1 Tax=Desulfosarcina widdelii TaxID=947919 RepID=A0A5K7ZAX0_9BACT|nr:branched-chain amino acid ABC transporter permease [Desulfosarcina widdelii]BBO76943.1 branched-chain amino acid ABC transporter permease [Desulfosarcina widdelii]